MKRSFAFIAVALATMAILACQNGQGFREVLQTASTVIQDNPQIIGDEEERARWVAGARAVDAFVNDIDTAEEIAIGQSLAVRAFVNFGQPHPDQQLQQYVAKVGKVIALQSERPSLPYSFAVVQSDRPNALALPGGYIFVSTGLLAMLNSEYELACILGHEISHVARKHNLEILGRDRKVARLVQFGEALGQDVQKFRQFIDESYRRLANQGYDQNYEWMADAAGTRYAYAAGYNPSGLVPFLQQSVRSGQPLAFESYASHPDPVVRLGKVRGVLDALPGWSGLPKLEDRYRTEVLSRLR